MNKESLDEKKIREPERANRYHPILENVSA